LTVTYYATGGPGPLITMHTVNSEESYLMQRTKIMIFRLCLVVENGRCVPVSKRMFTANLLTGKSYPKHVWSSTNLNIQLVKCWEVCPDPFQNVKSVRVVVRVARLRVVRSFLAVDVSKWNPTRNILMSMRSLNASTMTYGQMACTNGRPNFYVQQFVR
jgi:hypothetical protein